MIRVNLLGTKEPSAGGPIIEPGFGGGESSEKKGIVAGIAILGLAVGAVGVQWLSATRTINQLDEEINQLTEEKARLAPIIAQVEAYQAKLAELEEKERLIERLKNERQGPVRMLDALSEALPDFVWLTELTQRAGMVTIDGMAASLVSVADCIRKLENNEWFQNVELVDASINTRQEQEFTQFQLRTQLVSPSSPDSQVGGVPGGRALRTEDDREETES
jgi:Tfp pilus assembly protein PilN